MAKGVRINRGKKKTHFLPVLLVIAGILAASFLIAWFWQHYTAEGREQASHHSTIPSRKQPGGDSSAPLLTLPDLDSAEEPEQVPPSIQVEFGEPVPESEPVSDVYFDDAVFVGDSITDGVTLYSIMNNATVLAGTGINLDTVYTSAAIKNMETGERSSIMDNLGARDFKRVYILLGGNEVRYIEKDLFVSRYARLLDDVKEKQPDAVIYVQSITPVATANYYEMRNDRISEYNEAIKGLCKDKNVYYLDISETLKAEDGTLREGYAAVDGMHFEPAGYKAWFAYLRSHVVDAQPDELAASGTDSASVDGEGEDGQTGDAADMRVSMQESLSAQEEQKLSPGYRSRWTEQQKSGLLNRDYSKMNK